MRIGLIDVDGHHFPNLALMRISSYWKSQGDCVEWWKPDSKYHIVYKSKIFSDTYSKDTADPDNTTLLVKGGTGYAITTENGRERFNKCVHRDLPLEIEKSFPDYSIYPEFNFAVAMTSRGCPRGCGFCHVGRKEGRKSVKVANLCDFYSGQPHIEVLDPNILACDEKRDLLSQYREVCVPRKGSSVTFNQGLDIRLIDSYDIEDLNHMRVKQIHWAWDNAKENLKPMFEEFSKGFRRKNGGMVYCLTNFNSTLEEDLYRIYTLRELHYDPYVMIYNKPKAPRVIRDLQRWCNNKFIFKKCPKFEDYKKVGA